jgi:hypothetical protein
MFDRVRKVGGRVWVVRIRNERLLGCSVLV